MRARSLRLGPALALAWATLGSARPDVDLPKKHQADAGDGTVLLVPRPEGMILVQAGTTTLGSTMDEVREALALCRSEPLGMLCRDAHFVVEMYPHDTTLAAFWLDRTEVTVEAYRRCVAAGECSLPAFTPNDPRFDRPELPVTHVAWEDARRFCAYRGARLPTEAEWERAARGLGGRRFPWGMLANPRLANVGALDAGAIVADTDIRWGIANDEDGFAGLAPVGSFSSGATPDGIHDLAGNVAEWVADAWEDHHGGAAVTSPKGPPTGVERVVRGGSYRHPLVLARGASRTRRLPSTKEPTLGFRCAKDRD